MTTLRAEDQVSFADALATSSRSPEIPDEADCYGWLVGSWELDAYRYGIDIANLSIKAEVHFGWVLEGRGVQDVWIMPRRMDRTPHLGKVSNMFGTTLRVWDVSIQAWRVTWVNPVTGTRDELIGRWIDNEVVQVGSHADGRPIRRIFSEITRDSFRWTGEVLENDGRTWKLEGEFRARRRK